jgi:hypothetical protein
MSKSIYLDQNVLSDLRPSRQTADNKALTSLLINVIKQRKFIVLYSFVHLTEINQIHSDDYKREHIALLDDLGAIYIEPLTKKLNPNSAASIWDSFIENNHINNRYKIDDVLQVGQSVSKKIAGLPIATSFKDLHEESQAALNEMFSNMETVLESIDTEDDRERQAVIWLKQKVNHLKKQAAELRHLDIPEEHLGPLKFRDWLKSRGLNIDNIESNQVLPEIEALYLATTGKNFDWASSLVENSIENRITLCYHMLNWAGYYADDFTKIKKRSDRFIASQHDMMHSMFGCYADYLISNDTRFRKKASASFAYLKLPTTITSPEEFAVLAQNAR